VDFRGPYSRQQLTGRQFQCTETYDETTKNDHADFIHLKMGAIEIKLKVQAELLL
jgi:hypothetical protein